MVIARFSAINSLFLLEYVPVLSSLDYRARTRDCRSCLLKAHCCPKAPSSRLAVSPIIVVVGGAALLMALLGTIEAADCGALTGQGMSNLVSFILALIVLGALVGLAGMLAGACIDSIRSKLLAR